MTFIEKKYGLNFQFNEDCRIEHGQDFGCCGRQHLCIHIGFCVIPEKYGDGRKYCSFSKLNGWDKLKAYKTTKKVIRGCKKNEKVQVFKKKRKR